ncbi:unnamed protein product [[Actinomadura] parvosata subsp. kistnae]|uniref:N-acyltransferase N-terminal domain-containing protein n=1 Tax=[Actinomadura] parvosata subsp. kistnae TaxID=1909395 RepID=A0A1V0A307_9ACTN|nr:acyltransferase domain-containing protein [Nonomuraea sp. ATCC 55076]AQZ64596.1 hypothetical protein BKM31_26835 [Nonomuraea sp. ATCC 55076]SPL99577.1 unnamed protein product [Actinomadura parvosata subsp. kistnae]
MDVKALLRDHPAWLAHLESVEGPDLVLPADLATELLRLTVPHEDIGAVLAARPEPGSGRWWLAERCARSLVATMGRPDDGPPSFQPLPELGPYFSVYAFLGALPYTLAYHRELGIPAEVSQATFADLGRLVAVHMTCGSWLLDDQLRAYLPAGSHILAFQRRFRLLERAVADHLAAGGTWYGRVGWLPF